MDRLGNATGRLVELARQDMAQIMAEAAARGPAAARALLLELVPVLVQEYGVAASMVATEWYEELRAAANVPGDPPRVGPSYYAAGGVRAEIEEHVPSLAEPEGHVKALGALQGALQRYVLYGARATVRRNAVADTTGRPRYARVPSGAVTCAFCEMLASRGWVYWSRESAGDKTFGNAYHNDCDCQVVADFTRSRRKAHIDGYDPDAMYGRYKAAYAAVAARNPADAADPRKVLAEMRGMFPDAYTDGHVH